jgi:hypothetical protein
MVPAPPLTPTSATANATAIARRRTGKSRPSLCWPDRLFLSWACRGRGVPTPGARHCRLPLANFPQSALPQMCPPATCPAATCPFLARPYHASPTALPTASCTAVIPQRPPRLCQRRSMDLACGGFAPPNGVSRDSHQLKAAYAARSGRGGASGVLCASIGARWSTTRKCASKASGVAERPARPILLSEAVVGGLGQAADRLGQRRCLVLLPTRDQMRLAF